MRRTNSSSVFNYFSKKHQSTEGTTKPENNEAAAGQPMSETASPQKDEKMTALQDSYLRALADMENLRNRTKREVESAGQFAIQKFAKDIITVADILEMALGRAPKTDAEVKVPNETRPDAPLMRDTDSSSNELSALRQGMEMTLDELRKVLKTHGVTPIDPLHQRFDPNQHMALFEIPSDQVDSGTVLSVEKKGYLLNGRVIRAAQVAVSRKP